MVVLATRRVPGRLEGADCAALEGDLGTVGVVNGHCPGFVAAVAPVTLVVPVDRPLVDERPVDGNNGGDGSDGSDETRAVTVDDAYSAQVSFESGAVGTFEASRYATGRKNDHSIEIYGSEGGLAFSLERLNELEVLRKDGRGYETVLVTDPDDPYVEAWWPPGHVLGWEHAFVHENFEFLSSVRDGTEFHPSFEDAYGVQQVLDAIERSDASGERVDVT